MRRVILVLVVAAMVAVTMMLGSAGPALGIGKASPDLFGGCGGVNYAASQGKAEGNGQSKLSDIIVSSSCPDTLPPGQKVRESA